MKLLSSPTERRTTVDQDQATIDKYAKKFKTDIYFDVPLNNGGGAKGPRANTHFREIHAIPLSESPEAFWSTMHELGHINHEHLGDPFALLFGNDPRKPEQEAEAWAWAIDHAGRPLDATGKTSIGFSLSSYIYSTSNMHIGPNLKRMIELVGPKLDRELMQRLYPGENPHHFELAEKTWAKTWAKNAAPNELANAA